MKQVVYFLLLLKFAQADSWALPNITITEFNEDTGDAVAEHAIVLQEPMNKDIIVGEDTQTGNSLLLSCIAPYPVQWIYTGDGVSFSLPLNQGSYNPVLLYELCLRATLWIKIEIYFYKLAAGVINKYKCQVSR